MVTRANGVFYHQIQFRETFPFRLIGPLNRLTVSASHSRLKTPPVSQKVGPDGLNLDVVGSCFYRRSHHACQYVE